MSGWTLAECLADDGGVFVVRARQLPAADERARLPVAVWLGWSFGPADGADKDAVVAAMIAWEDAACAAADTAGWGTLIAVVTTGTAREWLFHAANGAEFTGELRALTQAGNWPALDVRVFDDPSWTAARELTARV